MPPSDYGLTSPEDHKALMTVLNVDVDVAELRGGTMLVG